MTKSSEHYTVRLDPAAPTGLSRWSLRNAWSDITLWVKAKRPPWFEGPARNRGYLDSPCAPRDRLSTQGGSANARLACTYINVCPFPFGCCCGDGRGGPGRGTFPGSRLWEQCSHTAPSCAGLPSVLSVLLLASPHPGSPLAVVPAHTRMGGGGVSFRGSLEDPRQQDCQQLPRLTTQLREFSGQDKAATSRAVYVAHIIKHLSRMIPLAPKGPEI